MTDQLREAARAALNELGVPGPDYAAPVANAVRILRVLDAIRERHHRKRGDPCRSCYEDQPCSANRLLAYIDGLAEALRAYIDHDLGGVHVTPGEEVADYEACETLHYRFGALAYPDKASEYGRLLAERDRLIGQGVDPADLDAPLPPGK
jgi:hypothetical protein